MTAGPHRRGLVPRAPPRRRLGLQPLRTTLDAGDHWVASSPASPSPVPSTRRVPATPRAAANFLLSSSCPADEARCARTILSTLLPRIPAPQPAPRSTVCSRSISRRQERVLRYRHRVRTAGHSRQSSSCFAPRESGSGTDDYDPASPLFLPVEQHPGRELLVRGEAPAPHPAPRAAGAPHADRSRARALVSNRGQWLQL